MAFRRVLASLWGGLRGGHKDERRSAQTNVYEVESHVRRCVEAGEHRAIIGGLWDELGALQIDFLKARGMEPRHALLDVGCGSGRLAVKAVPYLAAGKYHGLDISASLLQAARSEVEAIGLGGKLTPHTFCATADFRPSAEMPVFDYMIAQSVFSHLPLERFGAALDALRGHAAPGTRFYATFFTAPAGATRHRHKRGEVVTFSNRDPFHFTVEDIVGAARKKGWKAQWIGEWNHPRDQQMGEFSR